MLTKLTRLLTTMACCALVAGAANAAGPATPTDSAPAPAIQLGAPFCDNMVLQREATVPVWGWSKPGAKVTVKFAGKKATAKAGKDGKWVAELKGLKASYRFRHYVNVDKGERRFAALLDDFRWTTMASILDWWRERSATPAATAAS